MIGNNAITVVGTVVGPNRLGGTSAEPWITFLVVYTDQVYDPVRQCYRPGQNIVVRCSARGQCAKAYAATVKDGLKVVLTGRLRGPSIDDRVRRQVVLDITVEHLGKIIDHNETVQ